MKPKIMSIILVALMIFSIVPLTIFAHEEDNENALSSKTKVIYLEDNNKDEDSYEVRPLSENREKIREMMKERQKERLSREKVDDDSFKERHFDEELKLKYKAEYEKDDESFKGSLIKAERLKALLEQNKEKIKSCREGKSAGNNTICQELRQKSFENAKQYLLNNIDALINHLNSLKAQLQVSEELTSEEASERITKIDELIKDLNELKTELQSADSKDKVIDLNKKLKELFKDIKEHSLLSREYIKYGRIGEIIERAEHLEAKLARIQDRFGQNLTNNTELNSLIGQFEDKITDAKQKYNDARVKFLAAKNATSADEIQTLVKAGHALLVGAHKDLKDAHNLLKEIFRILKGIDKKIDFNEDKCWEDRPLFLPGKDLGYFVWQSKCNDKRFHIAWSGDTRNQNSTNASLKVHHMTGTITTNGEFRDVQLRKFERNDTAAITNKSKITFDAYVSTHFDAISFKTTGSQVTLDLFVDGERKTGLVFIGKNATNPSTIPFTLDAVKSSIEEAKCDADEFMVDGNCTEIAATNEPGSENDDDDLGEIIPIRD
ncbi:MAG: hypothetical protein AABW41_01100 [Nanoarchaeota archaeon]